MITCVRECWCVVCARLPPTRDCLPKAGLFHEYRTDIHSFSPNSYRYLFQRTRDVKTNNNSFEQITGIERLNKPRCYLQRRLYIYLVFGSGRVVVTTVAAGLLHPPFRLFTPVRRMTNGDRIPYYVRSCNICSRKHHHHQHHHHNHQHTPIQPQQV